MYSGGFFSKRESLYSKIMISEVLKFRLLFKKVQKAVPDISMLMSLSKRVV